MRRYLDRMDDAPYAGPRSSSGSPRVLAALRPRMLELARERAAGAHPFLVPVEHTRRAREALGPDRLLAPEQGFVLEPDPRIARAIARRYIAPMFSVPNYANNLRDLGFSSAELATEEVIR
jgi:probable F420-dependent oxidoreductase